ncbi:DUF1311 domain-containing protein [Acinetobacter pragensis]|uniref:DUF1311 domain-containing protein n=1 Tax=Acinetobacter pragensis TaxID=1806892 RepID=UPI0033415F06
MMNKKLMIGLMCGTAMLSGCDYFKNKKDQASVEEPKAQQVTDFSCTAPANVKQIQDYLKEEYLKDLDQRLRQSSFESDQALLDKIRKNIQFEITHISTKTENPAQAKTLDCSSLVTAILPNGLQKRAENAFMDAPCDECEREDTDHTMTLQDYLGSSFSSLTLKNDRLNGIDFIYHIDKSDKDEISMTIENHSVISQSAYLTELAVQYASYMKANEKNKEYSKKDDEQHAAQMELAQKALDVRQKEIDGEQKAAVEQLNMTWDRFSAEQKTSLQQDQSDWFEKRDVDCKVLSQKSVHQMDEKELETYQKKSDYWNDEMYAQNQAIQYSKCFIQKTKERTVYLNNVFN